jgi:hypothetical protein
MLIDILFINNDWLALNFENKTFLVMQVQDLVRNQRDIFMPSNAETLQEY